MDFFEMMKAYQNTPAMEADDITGQVNAEASKAGGFSQRKKKKADDEMNNTDDIFGVGETDADNDIVDPSLNQSAENTPDPASGSDDGFGGDDPTADNPGGPSPNGGGGMGDSNDPNGMGDDDPTGGMGNDFGGSSGATPEDDGSGQFPDGGEEQTPDIVKLENLRKNIVKFHEMVSGNLKLISENTPDILPEESTNLTSVIENLRECKNSLYRLVVEKFNAYPYAKLLSSYVAIQRAYELSAIMLEKYFDQLDIVDEDRAKQKEEREKKAKKSSVSLTKN